MVAVKLQVTAVTASGDDGNVPLNTIDGSLSTRWSSLRYGSWIQYNVQEADISSVKIAFYKGSIRRNSIRVMVATPTTAFSTVGYYQSSLTNSLQTFSFTAVRGTKVRITITSVENTTWCSITEGQVWGEPVAEAAPPGGTLDGNGIEYPQPLVTDGYNLTFANETNSFQKNFRSDGSMRCDFIGKRDSVMMAGYFYVTDSMPGYPYNGEEVTAKMNGGPHNDTDPDWADTMSLGITRFDGTKSRARWERDHPQYSDPIHETNISIGDVRKKWRGYIGLKVNLPNASPTQVALVGMVDTGGLNSSGKPVNNWTVTYKRLFTTAQIDSFGGNGVTAGLKSKFTPYVCTISQCGEAQNTIRIDKQGSPETFDNNYWKLVTCKTVTAVPV